MHGLIGVRLVMINVLVISAEPNYIFEKLKDIYMIKAFGATKVHLGCYYIKLI